MMQSYIAVVSFVSFLRLSQEPNRYYELNERYWNESVAQALRDREETSEELLQKFSDFMKKSGYEKKILGKSPECFAM